MQADREKQGPIAPESKSRDTTKQVKPNATEIERDRMKDGREMYAAHNDQYQLHELKMSMGIMFIL
jgi:hypothetical protein